MRQSRSVNYDELACSRAPHGANLGEIKMDRTEFLRQMTELFDLDEGSLQLSHVIEDTPGWSSLTFLGLIAVIDESYHTTIKPRQLLQCPTFGELYHYLQSCRSSSLVT